MYVLGIDPGSITTGWALIESSGRSVKYIDSGVLKFNSKTEFIDRVTEIKKATDELISKIDADEVAIESLIFVKNPNSMAKLAQTRGVILASLSEKFDKKIFEYAPTLIKAAATGYGHSDKESIQKFIDMLLGKREYQTHDESDAIAIALCHILNKGNAAVKSKSSKKSKGLAASLAHKV